MAEDKKKIVFEASGNLSDFMKKMQADGKNMYSQFAKEASAQTKDQKEQFKIIRDQINALKEQLRLEKELTKERLNRAKASYKNSTDPITEDFFLNKMNEQKAKLGSLNDQMRGAKEASRVNSDEGSKKSPKESSVFNDILKASLLKDLGNLFRQTATAGNGSDMISHATSIAGAALGGTTGAAIDAANVKIFGTGLGDVHASTVLATLGKEMGGFMGDAITRSFKLRDQYDQSYNRYSALTGGKKVSADLSRMGYDDVAVADLMGQVSGAAGTGSGVLRNTRLSAGLSRGYAIDQGISNAAFGMQRSGGGNGGVNMQRALGVAIAEGIDRTKFGDAIKNQTALLQHFAQSSNTVSSIDANRSMFEFNRMGGMFSLGDPRSISNIMGVSNGLSNPGSAFGQAQNYAILRKLNPNADAFQLKKMEEQGLQTPGFLKGVMDQISQTGMSPTLQKFMLKGRFGDLSYEAIDTLFQNGGSIDSMSKAELSRSKSLGGIEGQAEDLTSKYTRMNAEVSNSFRDSFAIGISTLSAQFVTEMGEAIREVSKMMWGDGDHKANGGHDTFGTDVTVSKTNDKYGANRPGYKAPNKKQIDELKSKLGSK